ncbi:MAG: cupredoxin domain-containing protein [Candidatus ainarchaeum sp.]|nr:cupredoxin domain-containing protein [Candidatus ainarchaeum sp.]
MSEEKIMVQKTTALLLAALAFAVLAGAYAVYAHPGAQVQQSVPAAANPGSAAQAIRPPPDAGPQPAVQDVYIRALGTGAYDKAEIAVKKGIPVRFHFTADADAGCGSYLVMEEFGVKLLSRNGEEQVAEFTPQQAGTYEYHCGMHMFVGRMVVS